MPLIHTQAVSWNSGVPTRLPRRSAGVSMPAFALHVDPAVPEHPGGEHRQRDERRRGLVQRRDVGGQRHLRDVELAVPQHPEERLLDRQPQVGQVDAVRAHAAVLEGAGPVVVAAGEREMQSGHRHFLSGRQPTVQSRVHAAGVELEDRAPVLVGQAEVVDVDERVVPGDAGLRVGAADRAEHLRGEQDVVGANHLVQQVDAGLVVDAGVEEDVAQQLGGVRPAQPRGQAAVAAPVVGHRAAAVRDDERQRREALEQVALRGTA